MRDDLRFDYHSAHEVDDASGGRTRRLFRHGGPVTDDIRYEVKLANGEVEIADSLWGAHHVIARRAAFDSDPLNPRNVLPARISKLGKQYFGGRTFVEEILSVRELSPEPRGR